MAKLLADMRGARFDDFTLRKASMRLSFSKSIAGVYSVFHVETNSYVSRMPVLSPADTEDVAVTARTLFDALEQELLSIDEVARRTYRFALNEGAAFYLIDLPETWDNVFSVRTVDWPEIGSNGAYFY